MGISGNRDLASIRLNLQFQWTIIHERPDASPEESGAKSSLTILGFSFMEANKRCTQRNALCFHYSC